MKMYLVTSEQMRHLDEETIKRYVPGLTLMERAGRGIFESVIEFRGDLDGGAVSIFLGRGNNAGDGLVAARLLAENGIKTILHYLHEPGEFSPDAFKNYERLKKHRQGGAIKEIFLYLADWEQKTLGALEESTLIVDALLGTGINSPVRENYARVIELINFCPLPVFAVDIPSGINGTTGDVMGTAVVAEVTVTMGLPKTGLVFYPGKGFSGSLEVVDIGIPDEVIGEKGINSHILDIDTALRDLPVRRADSHKFQCGSLLIVAGSRRYSGAAGLAAVSALRTGCGIVYLAGPESIRTAVQGSFPEIIFISLPETGSGSISAEGAAAIPGELRIDAAAIGPGITTDDETVSFVKKFVAGCEVPLLIDADGINAFSGRFSELKKLADGKEIVLSPHGGELKRLTGEKVPPGPSGGFEKLVSLVGCTGITLVHKGAPTVIAHPDGRIDVNVFGHPGMATAGSGDVLTGAIAGLLAQNTPASAAARLGVYLHSRAAEIAADDVGERGMIAGDCRDALPAAMKELEEEIFRI